MKRDIFKFPEYRAFLLQEIADNQGVRGYQARLATAARCPRSFISQVVHGDRDLNLEHAVRLSTYWRLDEDETEYFVRLVELARASFAPLQKILKRRVDELRDSRKELSKRFAQRKPLATISDGAYYSSWQYSALHILVGLEGKHTAATMAVQLSLPEAIVRDGLHLLESLRLVERRGEVWTRQPGHIHLAKDSPWTAMNHSNWRQRGLLDVQLGGADSLHYTSLHSHAFEDFERIKDLLLKAIDRSRAIVAPAPNEEMSCICIDMFRVAQEK